MRDLSGKVVVVTGAGSGIGRALAHAFAAKQAQVVVADVDRGRAALVVEESPGAVAVCADVTDPLEMERLRDEVLDRFGAVHVLCNNAGIAHASPILRSTAADWRRVIDVNLLGVVHGVLAFAPVLVAQGRGHIVNTASMAGFVAGADLASYDASKHAVVALTENLWRELQGTGVGVSLLAPAFVDTPLFANATGDTATRETFAATTAQWGIDAGLVAATTVAAVIADRFWVFTHPGTVQMTAIKSAYAIADLPPSDPFRAPELAES